MATNKNITLEQYPELTFRQFRLLCFMAYYGELNATDKPAADYRRYFKISTKAYNEDINHLVECGYLSSSSCVKKDKHLSALEYLFKNHSSVAKTFAAVYPYNKTPTSEFLWKLAYLTAQEKFDEAKKIPRPYRGITYFKVNLFDYIHSMIDKEPRYISLLEEKELNTMVSETLSNKFYEDQLRVETLDALLTALSQASNIQNEVRDTIDAYKYFLTGEKAERKETPTVWSLCVDAIEQFYMGKLEESLTYFLKAKEIITTKDKTFPSPIFNYAYGLLIYKLHRKYKDDESALIRLNTFKQSTALMCTEENILIKYLLNYIDKDPNIFRGIFTRKMEEILSRKNNAFYRTINYLLCHFFNFSQELEPEGLHSAAFFQQELSSYLPMGPDARAKYEEKFKGKPLIHTLRTKASWELLLSDVESCVAHRLENQEREKRIVYCLKDDLLHNIIEQYKTADGEWKDDRHLTLSQLASNYIDSMDSTDVTIATKLANKQTFSDAQVLIPLLVGTDRLFYDTYDNPKQLVSINNEAPRLEFAGKGFSIGISTNVNVGNNYTIPQHTIRKESTGHYTLISTNPLQRDLLHRFLSMGQFPTSAVISLRKVIEGLKGILDVKENIVDTALEPAILSKGILAIRIVPGKNDYNIRIQATAMEEGSARFIPAEGNDIVYDEVDGITQCINRDIRTEYIHYKELDNFLENELRAEKKSYTDFIIGTSESLLHLLAFIYNNQDRFFAEWPEGVKLKFKGEIKNSDIDMVVKSEENWFSVEGKVFVSGLSMPLEEFIKLCSKSENEEFIKLSDDEYIRISDTIKKHLALLDSLPSRGSKKCISKYQVGTLATTIEELKTQTDKGYSEFLQKTKSAFELDAPIPTHLNATLRDYQQEGFKWICRLDQWGAGACLADDMGLGKTLQSLTFLLHKSDKGPSLIVAPKSVILNWEAEATRFTPTLRPIILNSVSNRKATVENAQPGDLLLCTYGVLCTEATLLGSRKWNVVCLDEAHQIKNRQTMASQSAMNLQSDSRLILTGTPLQNNLGELWNLFQFINPGLLGPWSKFRDIFVLQELDYDHKQLLKDMTQPFILRRTKKQVLNELPEKIMNKRMIELSENETKVYEEMRRRIELKLKKGKSMLEKAEAATLDLNFFTELMNLRQAACSMKLVHDKWEATSSKVVALMEILDNIMADPENNVVIFSQFTSFLEEIKPHLKTHKMDFLYLDGQTPLEKRQELVKQFQSGEKRLFLSSLKAGGIGINLTTANYVILLDPWWNPAIENQAMDRAHRLGQKRVVSVIRLISSHTIEEKILRLHETKQNLSDDVLDGTNESYKLTYDDIMDMVAPF